MTASKKTATAAKPAARSKVVAMPAREKRGDDLIRIQGGKQLNGTIDISGAKNSALILMCASLLTDESMKFTNMPTTLRDIGTLTKVLERMGATIVCRSTAPHSTRRALLRPPRSPSGCRT